MVDLEKVIKEAKEQAERTAQWLRKSIEDAIASKVAEVEVQAASPFNALEAAGLVAKDIRIVAINRDVKASVVSVRLSGEGRLYFANDLKSDDAGGSGDTMAGECVLKPGLYRVVVLFFEKGG